MDPEDKLKLKSGAFTSTSKTWGENFSQNQFIRKLFKSNVTGLANMPEGLTEVMSRMLHPISSCKGSLSYYDDAPFFAQLLSSLSTAEDVIRQNQSNIAKMNSIRMQLAQLSVPLHLMEKASKIFPETVKPIAQLKEILNDVSKNEPINKFTIKAYLEDKWAEDSFVQRPAIDDYLFFERAHFRALKDELRTFMLKDEEEFYKYFAALLNQIYADINSPLAYVSKVLRDEDQAKKIFGESLAVKMLEVKSDMTSGQRNRRAKFFKAAVLSKYFKRAQNVMINIGQKIKVIPENTLNNFEEYQRIIEENMEQAENLRQAEMNRNRRAIGPENRPEDHQGNNQEDDEANEDDDGNSSEDEMQEEA